MKTKRCLLLLILLGLTANAQNKFVQLFYKMDVHVLTKEQTRLLKSSLDSLDNGNVYYFNITGYTDYVASKEYNMKLAKRRADNIKAFIQKKYPNLIENITTSAHGELITKEQEQQITANKEGVFENRRVDVIIMFAGKSKNPTRTTKASDDSFMGLPMNTLKKGDSIELQNLHFVLNTTELKKESQELLDDLVASLQLHPNVQISIEGHVCCGDVYTRFAQTFRQNQKKLSTSRARTIRDYLVTHGVATERLTYKGYGFTKPKIYPEETEEDKAANRRVIIRITYL